jgi:4-amino-4-deoxy-L-arabinose transferase-like glycosyltransferase
LLLFAVVTAAVFRFWQLGGLPPGLYRDEALNGLDALDVLAGKRAIYFPANNGREPTYIYLTALSILLFGRTATAVRLAAAIVGTLTTWVTFQLAKSWFGRGVGLLSAWLWAVTLWPVHLSRIGLRPILMAPWLACLFWLGTIAYRRQRKLLWLLTGLVFGAGFYTYLAFRLTPVLLLSLFLYLLLTGRRQALWPGVLWFGVGAAITLLPLANLVRQQPDLLLGRTGQVSVFNPDVNHGDWVGALGQSLIRAAGMFLWRGDTILRHNPEGRPVFDLFMALPFVAGVVWSFWHWRRKAAAMLLLWLAIMLIPTILAEDAPHFLRAAGLLPAVLLFPALGLGQLWNWQRLPTLGRKLLVIALIGASTMTTVFAYLDYGRQPEVAYLFETSAAEMAQRIRDDGPQTDTFIDERFWNTLPSIPFLVGTQPVTLFAPEVGLPRSPGPRSAIYAWPYGPLDFVPQALTPPALIFAQDGGLAREDLDETASPLYIKYTSETLPDLPETAVNFGDQLLLWQVEVGRLADTDLLVDLYWGTASEVQQELAVFVHVTDAAGVLVGQADAAAAAGRWPRQWWQPGLLVRDRHEISLPEPYDATRHRLQIGVYDAYTRVRLPVLNREGEPVGDAWFYEG